MSIFLKPGMVKVRQEDDEFSEINILAESSSQAYLDAIQAKGEEVLESIPSEYSDLVEEVDGKLDSPQTAGMSGQVLTSDGQGGQSWETPGECTVTDVQVDGASVLENGVANIPVASNSALGVAKIQTSLGVGITEKMLYVVNANSDQVKTGSNTYKPITPSNQHASAFYGLAKAAGDTTQSQSDNTVGTYTDEAKSAIQNMLNVPDKSDITVEDVQINGTSIVSDGVANVPVASANDVGVLKLGGAFSLGTDNELRLIRATNAVVKAGTNQAYPLVPYTQNQSTFYGLAKAAGVDMASSNNPIGTYTEEAKIAIQKMLGIYEAPWELIREDTFTNETEADHIITVDANGQAFELTDVAMSFETPKQDTYSAKGVYGQIHFYDNRNVIYSPEMGSWTQEANAAAHGVNVILEQKKGLLIVTSARGTTTSNGGNLQWRFNTPFNSANGIYQLENTEMYFTKVNIKSVTGTGHYKLYGKRKWQ